MFPMRKCHAVTVNEISYMFFDYTERHIGTMKKTSQFVVFNKIQLLVSVLSRVIKLKKIKEPAIFTMNSEMTLP